MVFKFFQDLTLQDLDKKLKKIAGSQQNSDKTLQDVLYKIPLCRISTKCWKIWKVTWAKFSTAVGRERMWITRWERKRNLNSIDIIVTHFNLKIRNLNSINIIVRHFRQYFKIWRSRRNMKRSWSSRIGYKRFPIIDIKRVYKKY